MKKKGTIHLTTIIIVVILYLPLLTTQRIAFAQQQSSEDFSGLKSQYEVGLAEKRIEAISKLAAHKTIEALSIIKQAAISDPDPNVRIAAITSLGDFAATSIEKGLNETALETALFALSDKEEANRKKAAQVLAASFKKSLTYDKLRDYIIRTARKDPTHSYETLALALNIYPSQSLSLFEELSKENDNCRYAVARLITFLPTIPAQKTASTERNYEISTSWNESIARLTEIFLKDELPEVRVEAVKAVATLKFYPLIKKSLPLITDKNLRVQSAARESLKKLSDQEAAIYWVGALSYPSQEVKIFTIEILSSIGRTDTFPYVFAMLDDKSQKVRTSAAAGAKTLFSTNYVFFLLNELSSQNRLKRKTALEILALSKDPKIIPALLSSMAKEHDKEILSAYTDTITEIATLQNIMDLREALSNNRYELRICGARALATLAKNFSSNNEVYNDIFSIFLHHIKYEKHPEVQKEMLTNAFPAMNPVPYRLAYHWTKIATKEIKMLTADFLAKYGKAPETTEVLMESLSEHITSDQEVAWRLKDAIEKLTTTPSSVAQISKFLSLPKKEMRLFILGIMKKIPSEEALKNLELIEYKKADTEVKYSAIEAVRAAKPQSAPPILSYGITDKNPEIRWIATKALSEITNTPITEEILSALSDPNPAVREETLKILARNPRFEYAQRIIPLLSDQEISVRRAALEAIQDITDIETAKKKIIPMLNDTDATIRALSARICGKIIPISLSAASSSGENTTTTEEVYILALRKMMESDLYPECRREAANALWKIGDKSDKTVSIYFLLLKDNDIETRKTAEGILDSILTTEKPYKPFIIRALVDENPNSRAYALKSITRLRIHDAIPELFNLVKMSKRGNKKENQMLLDTLSVLLDENDVPALEEIYKLGNPELKLWAIEQAGHLKSESALNLITRALKEENPAFRQKAMESLVRTSHPEARAALRYIASNDPDPVLRKMAQEKLNQK